MKAGTRADNSVVAIDRLPATRMKGRTRITSRLPMRVAVETRITWRAEADSLGGGRRSALRMVAWSFEPIAPRSAPSTFSGSIAKVVSPSSDAKTAPPMRAAPQRPVRIVPENHCTEMRRRSITPASLPSTESGGSCPRSMIPASALTPPRDVPWFKIASPTFQEHLRASRSQPGVRQFGTSRRRTGRSVPRNMLAAIVQVNPRKRRVCPKAFGGRSDPSGRPVFGSQAGNRRFMRRWALSFRPVL